MRLLCKTRVGASVEAVWVGFDRSLFERLAPPFPALRILSFEGSRPGDRIEVELNFGLFQKKWISRITESFDQGPERYFVDEGVPPDLPFGLKQWRHVHRLRALPDGRTSIEDDISFTSGNPIWDVFLWVGFYFQIGLWRKPIYRRHFAGRK
jgi:ligand-binding SRPBCC domain-containing protein